MEEEIPGLIITPAKVELDGTDVSEMTITIHDCMSAGHCVRGVKKWFEFYEFDFRSFLAEGISCRDFLSTRDGHAIGIVRHKLRVGEDG